MDTENEENTPDQKALLAAEEALDAAGAPRTDTQRDGIGINLELSLASRIQWLSQMFADQLHAVRQRAEGAERNLSELHIELRRACAAESVSEALEHIYTLRGAQEKLDHFVSQRDAEVVALEAALSRCSLNCEFFKKQADDSIVSLRNVTFVSERWKSQCIMHERTIHELAAKVEVFALATDPIEKWLRADYVIDVPTGLVIKSRTGKAHMLNARPATSNKKRTTPKTAKPKSKLKSKKR